MPHTKSRSYCPFISEEAPLITSSAISPSSSSGSVQVSILPAFCQPDLATSAYPNNRKYSWKTQNPAIIKSKERYQHKWQKGSVASRLCRCHEFETGRKPGRPDIWERIQSEYKTTGDWSISDLEIMEPEINVIEEKSKKRWILCLIAAFRESGRTDPEIRECLIKNYSINESEVALYL